MVYFGSLGQFVTGSTGFNVFTWILGGASQLSFQTATSRYNGCKAMKACRGNPN